MQQGEEPVNVEEITYHDQEEDIDSDILTEPEELEIDELMNCLDKKDNNIDN